MRQPGANLAPFGSRTSNSAGVSSAGSRLGTNGCRKYPLSQKSPARCSALQSEPLSPLIKYAKTAPPVYHSGVGFKRANASSGISAGRHFYGIGTIALLAEKS